MNVTKLALALEKAKINSPLGEISVRAADHQALVPLIVSKVSKEAKYKRKGLSFGLKPEAVIPSADAINPVQPSCKMNRPA